MLLFWVETHSLWVHEVMDKLRISLNQMDVVATTGVEAKMTKITMMIGVKVGEVDDAEEDEGVEEAEAEVEEKREEENREATEAEIAMTDTI